MAEKHWIERQESSGSYAIYEIQCRYCEHKEFPMQHRSKGNMGRVSHCRALMRQHVRDQHTKQTGGWHG